MDRNAGDGIVVRPVVPDDLAGLEALFDALDEQARYRRWFTCGSDLRRAIAWAAHPEAVDAIGLVAVTAAGAVIGHAALVPYGDGCGEVCFEVDATWRHHGVAGRLLAELDRRAAGGGVRTLVAEVLPENADMLAVMREHGHCAERYADGVWELALAVRGPDAIRAGAPSGVRTSRGTSAPGPG